MGSSAEPDSVPLLEREEALDAEMTVLKQHHSDAPGSPVFSGSSSSCGSNFSPSTALLDALDACKHEDRGNVTGTSSELQQSALRGEVEKVRELIRCGASVNAPLDRRLDIHNDGEFITLTHALASRPDLVNSHEILIEILDHKANIDARSSLGSTPLMRSCLHKHLSVAEILLGRGAQTQPVDANGRNAMRCAASLPRQVRDSMSSCDSGSKSAQLIQLLAKKNGDVNLGGHSSQSTPPLLEAVRHSNNAAVTSLLELGVKPRWLHEAVDNGSLAVVQALLDGKADPFSCDAEGKSPLDVALRRGHQEITNLLRDTIGDLERSGRETQLEKGGTTSVAVPGAIRFGENETVLMSVDSSAIASRRSVSPVPQAGSNQGSFRPDSSRNNSKDTTGGHLKARRSVAATGRKSVAVLDPNSRRSVMIGVKERELQMIELERSQTARGRISGMMKKGMYTLQTTFYDIVDHEDRRARLQIFCRKLNRSRRFQILMFCNLFAALFLPDFWIITNQPNNDVLDVMLTLVLFLFLVELTVQCLGVRKYVGSFFFWMDILGTVSMLLDISYIISVHDSPLHNTTIMRVARLAKLGARAGRFTKLVKLLRFLPGMDKQKKDESSVGTARVISNQLFTSLSTRVSCLIIIMVMILPTFEIVTYPLNDWSMSCWVNDIEETVVERLLPTYPSMLLDQLDQYKEFYEEFDYYPYKLQISGVNITDIDLDSLLQSWSVRVLDEDNIQIRFGRPPPTRAANDVTVTSKGDVVKAFFNFEEPNKFEAGMNVLLVWTVIMLMLGFTALLSHSTSVIVLRPLEQLLSQVRNMASTMFKNVTDMAMVIADDQEGSEEGKKKKTKDFDDDEGDVGAFGTETHLLNIVVQKIAVISELTMKKSLADKEALEMMGEAHKADEKVDEAEKGRNRRASLDDTGTMDSTVLKRQKLELQAAGLTVELVDSWNFNPLDMDDNRNCAACTYILAPVAPMTQVEMSHATSEAWSKLQSFLDAAQKGYVKDIPYHNWYHAVDVIHTTYRQMKLCDSLQYFGAYECFALLVAALGHDIGHPGLNNPFLVETSHELALRYNDKSPLENMHCAKLFEITQNSKTAIFSSLDKQQYKEVRNICIESILHTDMVHHFSLVKEMQMLYEVNSDILDVSRELWREDNSEFPPFEVVEKFRSNDNKKLLRNLFLHVSDVSNPMKPFHVCKAWAWKVLEEFFMQGDQEKELGIAVQMLNDREKVNRAFSQVGFIEFLVSPLILATVRVFPPLEHCADELLQNMKCWKEEWVTATTPTPSQDEQKAVDERISKLEAKYKLELCR